MKRSSKDNTILALMSLTIVLGIIGVSGDDWLVPESFNKEQEVYSGFVVSEVTGSGMSLSAKWTKTDMMTSTSCLASTLAHDYPASTVSCDGSTMLNETSFGSLCIENDSEDYCSMEQGGSFATVGIWGGIVAAIVAVVNLIYTKLNREKMDTDDSEKIVMITTCSGTFMLFGILAWWIMLPSLQGMVWGFSAWNAIIASALGIGSAIAAQKILVEDNQTPLDLPEESKN